MHNSMVPPPNAAALQAIAADAGVRYIRLIFADVLGTSKNVVVPISELGRALAGRVTFDGGSIDGFVRDQEIDMILRPDPTTFALLPRRGNAPPEARLICDIAMPDGEPFEGCPRTTLRRNLVEAAGLLPQLRAGLEVEFYLFDALTEGAPPTTADAGSYFDLSVDDRGEAARTAIVAALEAMQLPITAMHHEHGSGQHEINLRETGVLQAADHLATLRMVAKQIATDFGLHATFMPKPLEGSAGSGLHVYFCWGNEASPPTDAEAKREFEAPSPAEPGDDDLIANFEELDRDAQELQAVLYDQHDRHENSDEMLFAVGGLLQHAPACTAVCNPLVNSYKRLVAAWDAPVYTVWSHRSANALVRVPRDTDYPRIEMRSPDSCCNPYLALTVLVASIADGFRSHILPGDPLVGTTYDLDESERLERGIRTLPHSLREALDELDADPIIRNALGDHLYRAFYDAKTAEYESYRRAVHPWEQKQYLKTY